MKRLILFAALLLTVASGAWAEPIPQVIWCSGNSTLYFVNDGTTHEVGQTYENVTITGVYPLTSKEDWRNAAKNNCTKVVFDNSFASVRPTSCNEWFWEFYELTSIEGLSNLNTSEVTDLSYMFAQCQNLQSLDLSHFNTAKVKYMDTMFLNCFGLNTLDLSSFDTSIVETIVDMFHGCNKLQTLTVASGWTKVGSREGCFSNCSPSTIHLVMDDEGDSQSLMEEFGELISGKTVNVTLRNRKLYKDGDWNTLCLPFDVTIAGSSLAGATLKELDTTQSNLAADGKLTLTFKDATNIQACKPYLIKWNNTEGTEQTEGTENIVDPVFNGVTISSYAPTPVTFTNAQGSDCSFVGQYKPFVINSSNQNTIVMLSSGSRIGYSNNVPRTLRSMRAHFEIPTSGNAPAMTAYEIDFDGEESTGIISMHHSESIMHHEVYDLQGRRVESSMFNVQRSMLKKGLYIINGKKVLIP